MNLVSYRDGGYVLRVAIGRLEITLWDTPARRRGFPAPLFKVLPPPVILPKGHPLAMSDDEFWEAAINGTLVWPDKPTTEASFFLLEKASKTGDNATKKNLE